MEILLDAGCSPNLTNSELSTPLHMAAKKGFPDVAEHLVQAETIDLVGDAVWLRLTTLVLEGGVWGALTLSDNDGHSGGV